MSIREVLNSKLESNFNETEQHLDISFDKIINFIDQIFIFDFPISKFNNQKQESLQPNFDQFKLIGQSQFQSQIIQDIAPLMNSQIKHQLQIQLQSNQDHQQQFIKSQISQVQQPQEQQIKSLSNIKSFNYQIINHNYIQQQEYCNLVAFNKDGSILAVGCDNLINLYEFSQGMLKYNQSLNDHQDTVNTLYFMRQSNQIISGDQNGYI